MLAAASLKPYVFQTCRNAHVQSKNNLQRLKQYNYPKWLVVQELDGNRVPVANIQKHLQQSCCVSAGCAGCYSVAIINKATQTGGWTMANHGLIWFNCLIRLRLACFGTSSIPTFDGFSTSCLTFQSWPHHGAGSVDLKQAPTAAPVPGSEIVRQKRVENTQPVLDQRSFLLLTYLQCVCLYTLYTWFILIMY